MSTKIQSDATVDGYTVTLSFSINQMIESLNAEEASDMVQRLSCSREIFNHVVDQICDGATENSSSTYDSDIARAREKLLMKLDTVHAQAAEDRAAATRSARHAAYLDGVYAAFEMAYGSRSNWSPLVEAAASGAIEAFKP